MELIKEIIINDPPTKYREKKVRESKKQGKEIFTTYYLTANIFTNSNISYFITQKIKDDCKFILQHHIDYLPKLEKMRVDIHYSKPTHIDADNVFFFWTKLILDLLKTPTPKQIAVAKEKGREIISMHVIPDDSTKYVDPTIPYFEIGEHVLTFKIYGRLSQEQTTMNF